MEPTSCTTLDVKVLAESTMPEDHIRYNVIDHELSHQWSGDLVTCRDWMRALLLSARHFIVRKAKETKNTLEV